MRGNTLWLSLDDLTPNELSGQSVGLPGLVCAFVGPDIPMRPEQFARLVDASKEGMLIGRDAVLRAIEPEDGDDAHH